MTLFLTDFCKETRNNTFNLSKVESLLDNTLFVIGEYLGKDAFRLGRSRVNAGLIDCLLSAGLWAQEADPDIELPKLGELLKELRRYLVFTENTKFALTNNTSTSEHVLERMGATENFVIEHLSKKVPV